MARAMWSKRGAVCLLALTTCCCWLATAAQQQQQQDTDAAVPTTTLSSSLSTTAGNHSESDSHQADGESLQNGRARSQQQQPAGTGSVCGRDGDCPALLACLAGTCQDPCTALPCPLDGAHCKGGHQHAHNVCPIFKSFLLIYFT
jgi:hypothetical protein